MIEACLYSLEGSTHIIKACVGFPEGCCGNSEVNNFFPGTRKPLNPLNGT